MYAGVAYAGAPYAGSSGAPTDEEITLPLIGNVATAFAPFISTTYPAFDPDDWPNEVQTITVGGSGLTSFTLTFDGQTTGSIPADATASQVYTALIGLSNIEPDEVNVSGPAGGPWVVTFQNGLGHQDVPLMTATPTGGTGTVTPVETTAGVEPPPWWTPDAVPLGSADPYGVSVEMLDLDGNAAPVVWLSADWQDQLASDGAGLISVDETTAVAGENLLRFSLHGVKAFQAVVDSVEPVIVHEGEEHDQIVTLRGRGALTLLENASVWQTSVPPSLGLNSRPLSDVRYFNYAEVFLDDTWWGGAVATDPDYDGANLFGRPKGMKDATGSGAKWIWGIPGGVPVPGGFNYFRQYFDYDGPPSVVRLEAAADDEVEIWVDGVPILEITGVYAGNMKYTTFELTPGTHLVAARGNNRNALRAGIIWSIGTMDSRGRFLDVIAHSVPWNSPSGSHVGSNALAYPPEPPGITIGRAWRILYLEAIERGEIPYIGDTIDEVTDYNGTPWAITSELSVRLDQSLLDVARMWGETYWDIVMSPSTLDPIACLKGQLGSDVNVTWNAGDELLLDQRTYTSAPTVALVRFDGGRIEVEHPDVATKGRKVRAISLGHVKSPAQAAREGLEYLESAKRREETRAIQIDSQNDLAQDVYLGARVGDSPIVSAVRQRIHGINVVGEDGDYTVTPEIISAQQTVEERLYIASTQMSPGSAAGRSRAVKPAPDINFPAGQDGREYPLGFSWEEVTGEVQLLAYLGDGTTATVIATLNPIPGTRGKTVIDPPVQINELTNLAVSVGGVRSQLKRTDEGIWLMEFKVDRDFDETRGTAEVLIA